MAVYRIFGVFEDPIVNTLNLSSAIRPGMVEEDSAFFRIFHRDFFSKPRGFVRRLAGREGL